MANDERDAPTPSGPKAPLSIRLGELEPTVTARRRQGENLQAVLRRDLTRYYKLLEDGAREFSFSVEEAGTLCYLIDSRFDPAAYRYIWAEVEKGAEEERRREAPGADAELGPCWLPAGLDDAALVRRLRELSPAASMALLDRIERYCAMERERCFAPLEPDLDAMEKVGLISAITAERAREKNRARQAPRAESTEDVVGVSDAVVRRLHPRRA